MSYSIIRYGQWWVFHLQVQKSNTLIIVAIYNMAVNMVICITRKVCIYLQNTRLFEKNVPKIFFHISRNYTWRNCNNIIDMDFPNHLDGLVQDCSFSIVNALEIL